MVHHVFEISGYYTFGEIDQNDPEQYVDSYVEYAQSLVNYAKDKGEIVELPSEFISTQLLVDINGTAFPLSVDEEEMTMTEATDPSACAVTEDNDDEFCGRYIDRLPSNQTCDCYNFCNGVLTGCYEVGQAQEEAKCSDFPRLGCTAEQGTPGTSDAAMAPSLVIGTFFASIALFFFL